MILPFRCRNYDTRKTCQCLNSNCTVNHSLAIFFMVCSSIVVKLLLPLRNPLEDPQPWSPSLLDLPSRKPPEPEFKDWGSTCKMFTCKSVERWTWMPSCWSFNTLRISVSANWSTLYFSPPLRTAVCDWSRTWCTERGVKQDKRRNGKINWVEFLITWLRSSFSRPLNCVGVANSACNCIENQLRPWFKSSTDQFDHL